MTSTTSGWSAVRPNARHLGAVLCGLGLAMLWIPSLVGAALGAELLAAAFWVWARATENAREQVARWAWLRRPAQALWLAAAVQILMPELLGTGGGSGAFELLRWLQAGAVVWPGLELLAALPLARPYSDLPGPLLSIRPWLPAILPAAGFMLLWRHQDQWIGVPQVRDAASVLLLLTAILAALRAFGRLQWLVSLRWLLISDSALAGLLVALGAVRPEASMLLWLAACGGRTFLLANELRSAAPRRGHLISTLWRAAGWVSSTALSWPILTTLGFGPRGHVVYYLAAALPVAITAWVIVGRLEEAPERRMMVRPTFPMTLGHAMALLVLILAPVALVSARLLGWTPSIQELLVALLPSASAGTAAVVVLRWRRIRAGITAEAPGVVVDPAQSPERLRAEARLSALEGTADRLRSGARAAFRAFTGFERRVVAAIEGLGSSLISPVHELHTGDAQEYLLLLVGLSVLALVLPLLQ